MYGQRHGTLYVQYATARAHMRDLRWRRLNRFATSQWALEFCRVSSSSSKWSRRWITGFSNTRRCRAGALGTSRWTTSGLVLRITGICHCWQVKSMQMVALNANGDCDQLSRRNRIGKHLKILSFCNMQLSFARFNFVPTIRQWLRGTIGNFTGMLHSFKFLAMEWVIRHHASAKSQKRKGH